MLANVIKLSVTCSRNSNRAFYLSNILCKQYMSCNVIKWQVKSIIARLPAALSTSRRFRHNTFPSFEETEDTENYQERENTKERRFSQVYMNFLSYVCCLCLDMGLWLVRKMRVSLKTPPVHRIN